MCFLDGFFFMFSVFSFCNCYYLYVRFPRIFSTSIFSPLFPLLCLCSVFWDISSTLFCKVSAVFIFLVCAFMLKF